MANTLYDYYNQKGSRLGSTVDQRFSDPEFNSAAQRAGITKDSYSINQGNGSYNQRILAELSKGSTPAPVQAPTVINPNSTTGADLMKNSGYTAPDYSNQDFSNTYDYYGNLANQAQNISTTNVDESSIYNQTLDKFKGELDSLRNVYNDTITKARISGQGNLGSNRAIQARSGLLGSDMGASQTANVNEDNTNVENEITNQYQLNVQKILSGARADAQREIDSKNEAKRLGVSEYLKFNKEKEDRRDANLKKVVASMITMGDDPSKYSPLDLKNIASALKISDTNTLLSEYTAQKGLYDQAQEENRLKQESLANKDRYKSLSDGSQLIDTQTGKAIADNMKSTAKGNNTFTNKTTNENPIVDAWVSQIKNGSASISSVPAGIRDSVVQALSADGGKITKILSSDQSKVGAIVKTLPSEIERLRTILKNNTNKKGGNLLNNYLGEKINLNPELDTLVNQVADKIGRLRSGGAINKDEEARFKKLIIKFNNNPRSIDNALNGILNEAQEVTRLMGIDNEERDNGGIVDPLGIRN